ncbi:ABC transporter ATP-binding protein [Photobacterium atrarenae]|uniref:ABC transporter ATP-binding protein n=1 Tax=Photobacterium atrarenae TaxID=865757 RepID=A0ABY5GKK9_9GAMM|nr:ABC transporter ATP-binding protein [Photobacterium atrarenae]UTV29448.1 ABC transporter ATP-binding protein [Photobacterium atrarenae]
MTATKPIISLSETGKQYQQLDALQAINLALNPGEVLGLFGHNGAGKTTMMKIILGVIPASSGEVRIFGVDPQSKQAWQSRRQIGYLPENVSFYDHLTGLEILTYFARLKQVSQQEVPALLAQVGLTHALNRKVKHYSKGMRQRLGLAQAFLGNPKLLLLDEPTVGLDPIATQDFYQRVDQLKSNGTSVILCSHVLPGVEQHIDRAMILAGGRQKAIGTLAQLREKANLPATIRIPELASLLSSHPELSQWQTGPEQLQVPEKQKLAVIRQLLDDPLLPDISIEPANLEQLYQYYLNINDAQCQGAVAPSAPQPNAAGRPLTPPEVASS